MSPKLAAQWLTLTGWAFVAFGLIFTGGAWPGLDAGARILFDLLAWPLDGLPGAPSQEARWLAAIGGGLTAAIGVMLAFAIAPLLGEGNATARNGAIAGVLTWFVLDSTGSIGAGVASNALFNVPLAAMALVPLFLARR